MSFDHRDPGTPAAAWEARLDRDRLESLPVHRAERILVVAAHPDDETLGAGGLIATCARLGIPVRVLVLTDGAGSHPGSPTTTPAALAVRRRAEVDAAVRRLAAGAEVRHAGLPDGRLAGREGQVAALIADALREWREESYADSDAGEGREVWIVAPSREDGHPDHEAAGAAAAEVALEGGARLVEYPIWFWHWADAATADLRGMRVLGLGATEREAKIRAVLDHASQVGPLSAQAGDEALLHGAFLAHFLRGEEVFRAVDASVASVGARYFDDMFGADPDPWGFATRWYERRKRSLLLAALPEERVGSVLEVGCANGDLTRELAGRGERLLAVDLVPSAVERARAAVEGMPGVTVRQADVVADFPPGRFDLIVLSEVGYYLDDGNWRGLLERVSTSLEDAGTVVLCHWRHAVPAYALTGDAVHALAERSLTRGGLRRLHRTEERDLLLDVYSRDERSVAERTGLRG